MGRGVAGLVLRTRRTRDHVLTVTGTERVTERRLRVRCTSDLLAHTAWFPTMWVRLWVPRSGVASPDPESGALVPRGYTLIEPDGAGFTIEFVLHDGPAARWARGARPGDRIAATLTHVEPVLPPTTPTEYLLVGDAASLPAINSLLPRLDAPARVVLEYQHDSELRLPVAADDVVRVPRRDRGAGLVDAVRRARVDPGAFAFVAAESAATRGTVGLLRREVGLPGPMIASRAYWLDRSAR